MKLPRGLVIAMLTSSVLAVLAAAGWWWVTWPDRTAEEFVDLLKERRWDDANKLTGLECEWSGQPRDDVLSACRDCPYYFEYPAERTVSDLICGRQSFSAGCWNEWTLTAQFGKITAEFNELPEGVLGRGTGKPWYSTDLKP